MRKVYVISWIVLVSLLFTSCTNRSSAAVSASVVEAMSGPATAGFARATEPMHFEFPKDHGAHPNYRTEWWYYTGNLQAEDGSPFGYQLTFFRSGLTPALANRSSDWASNQIYMAHFALTDGSANQHVSFERFSRGAAGLAGAMLGTDGGCDTQAANCNQLWLDDWSVRYVEPGVMQLRAQEQNAAGVAAVDLTLRERRTPLLHGNQGFSQKSGEVGNASYYYSLVQIETSGTITNAGKATQVQGVSWMDHEFGTTALGKNDIGWDWFSVQLENGVVLMFAQIRTQGGGIEPVFDGTIAWPDGRQALIKATDLTIQPTDQWTSPRTGFVYPSGWQVSLPNQAVELSIQPLIQDQEMNVSFVYWEGAVKVSGTVEGASVAGNGYVELTGYGKSNTEYQR
ncbi:MAG: lipocalin-like domain-containing protein [Caldilineaceae bacterium]